MITLPFLFGQMPRISNNTTTTIMDPSKKQAMVHIAATTIKYMCPHLKTLEVMKIVKFNDEDLKHAFSFWRATDRRVTQLRKENDIAPVALPVPAINTLVMADACLSRYHPWLLLFPR